MLQKVLVVLIYVISGVYAKPVNVSVYYQTLCPASQFLLQHQIWDLYNGLFKEGIVDINLHAFGNTHEQHENGTFGFTCQHGDLECKLNTIANCAGRKYKQSKPGKVIEFIHCLVEPSVSGPTVRIAKDCASTNGIDWDNIDACSSGLLGYDVQHKEALITPEHDQIPWVMVNGIGNSVDQEDLRNHLSEIVCNQYTGTPPKSCLKGQSG